MRTAAAFPEQVGAGASFHGGRLVTDAPDGPHLLVDRIKAHYLFALEATTPSHIPSCTKMWDGMCRAWGAAGNPVRTTGDGCS